MGIFMLMWSFFFIKSITMLEVSECTELQSGSPERSACAKLDTKMTQIDMAGQRISGQTIFLPSLSVSFIDSLYPSF